jgi:putative ABC transport system ATP-binding protein
VSALVLQSVSKARGRRRHAAPAVCGVCLAVEPGELVLLEGPSGAGKTTLLALAGGLLTPDEGRVEVAGCDLASLSSDARRRLRARVIGFVFQRPNLIERLSVLDNVRIAAGLAGVEPREAERQACLLLERLGIASLAGRRPSEISGGEEQRASVARALVHRPTLVLADEPTACLDGVSGRGVAEALASLARERGAAVLVATHDARLAPFATRRVSLCDGRLGAGALPRDAVA